MNNTDKSILKIFVAGAIHSEDHDEFLGNIRKGCDKTLELARLGFAPFPTFFNYNFAIHSMGEFVTRDFYYKYSLEWLKASDAVFLVDGWLKSEGAKSEQTEAVRREIPTFEDMGHLINYARQNGYFVNVQELDKRKVNFDPAGDPHGGACFAYGLEGDEIKVSSGQKWSHEHEYPVITDNGDFKVTDQGEGWFEVRQKTTAEKISDLEQEINATISNLKHFEKLYYEAQDERIKSDCYNTIVEHQGKIMGLKRKLKKLRPDPEPDIHDQIYDKELDITLLKEQEEVIKDTKEPMQKRALADLRRTIQQKEKELEELKEQRLEEWVNEKYEETVEKGDEVIDGHDEKTRRKDARDKEGESPYNKIFNISIEGESTDEKIKRTIDEIEKGLRGRNIGRSLIREVTKDKATDEQVGGNYYKDNEIQPIEYIQANNLGFEEGNVVKYITRWREKGGVKDLDKIKHYVELLKEREL